jgi:putative DNA primase/helicase
MVRSWWYSGKFGIGVISGAVSGNLECIDFDRGELVAPWQELVEGQIPGLVDRLCRIRTPRQLEGYHVRYRCTQVTIPGNMKLASEPGTDEKTGKPCQITLIETRGEGGYALAPGSPSSCHATGRTWDHVAGPPLTDLPDITADERDVLIAAARSFDLSAASKVRRPDAKTTGGVPEKGLRPGDDYDRRGPDWSAILEPHGWQRAHSRGTVVYWRRPGKDTPGISATTGYCHGQDGTGLLAVFSSNAHPFEGPRGPSPAPVTASSPPIPC